MEFPFRLSGPKKRQHYVFRSYLLPWTTNEQLWAVRAGKIFRPNVRNVGVEAHFYELQELTEEDITLIRRIGIDGAPQYVQERCNTLIDTFTLPFKIKNMIDPGAPDMKAARLWLDERIINHEEELHGDIENALLPALSDMLAGKTGFYSDKDQAQEFLHAITFQYMRTKKRREAFHALTRIPVAGADVKRFGNLLTLILTLRFADSLYRDRSKFKVVIIDNETGVPFITGDQPIINIHATLRQVASERLEFFYPLSPYRAMLLLEIESEHPALVSVDEVANFNNLILRNSHEQVFSNSRESLETLMASR
jgi:Protein of unknown function (DUF4238)